MKYKKKKYSQNGSITRNPSFEIKCKKKMEVFLENIFYEAPIFESFDAERRLYGSEKIDQNRLRINSNDFSMPVIIQEDTIVVAGPIEREDNSIRYLIFVKKVNDKNVYYNKIAPPYSGQMTIEYVKDLANNAYPNGFINFLAIEKIENETSSVYKQFKRKDRNFIEEFKKVIAKLKPETHKISRYHLERGGFKSRKNEQFDTELLKEGKVADLISKIYVRAVFYGIAPLAAIVTAGSFAQGKFDKMLSITTDDIIQKAEQIEEMPEEELEKQADEILEENGLSLRELQGMVQSSSQNVVNTEFSEDFIKKIKEHEGERLDVYLDTRGYWTVGVGYLIGKKNNGTPDTFYPQRKKYLQSLGIDVDALWNSRGKKKPVITNEQSEKILLMSLEQAKKDVIEICKEKKIDYISLPIDVKHILIDLSFNMGKTKLSKFRKTLYYIKTKKWKLAAQELKKSLWYTQVGNRGKYIVSKMTSIKENRKYRKKYVI